MKIIITITTDNAAFEPEPERETARILRSLAYDIYTGDFQEIPLDLLKFRTEQDNPLPLWDVNGNPIGKIEAKES